MLNVATSSTLLDSMFSPAQCFVCHPFPSCYWVKDVDVWSL